MTTDDDTAWVFTHMIHGGKLPANPLDDAILSDFMWLGHLSETSRHRLRDHHHLTPIQLEILEGILPSWDFSDCSGLIGVIEVARALV